MLKIKEINPALIQTPPVGKAIVFLNSLTGNYTILKDNGLLVDLEQGGGGGASDAESVTYLTTDNNLWSWATAVPTNVEVALDTLAFSTKDIYSTIDLLLPPKASTLSSLIITDTVLYVGKISADLASSWYTENSAGDTVTNLIYDNIFYLEANNIRCGKSGQNSTYGVVNFEKDGSTISSYNISLGNGTNGVIQILNLQTHNTFWQKTDIKASATATEGFNRYRILHTEAGASILNKFVYDNIGASPNFISPLVVSVNTKSSKYLSGIEYYGLGSTFDISFTTANSFNKVYSSSGVCILSCIGMTNLDVDPISVPNYTDNFIVANRTVTLNNPNQSSLSPIMIATATKPNNNNVANSQFNIKSNLSLGICTFGIVSTTTSDSFQDENQRLVQNTALPFNSITALSNGEAQVRVGTLVYGNTDYPLKSGDQRYDRYIVKATANSGSVTFGGLTYTNISPFGTGSINIILQLENDNIYFDLGRPFGSNNGNGNGLTMANSKGARVSGSSNLVNFTFGTYSTANNSNKYRIIIIFKNNVYSLTSITAS